MNVKLRQELERRIASAAISSLIAGGFSFAVDNGEPEGEELPKSTTLEETLALMFLTDEDRLYVYQAGKPAWFGWVYFVYGNDGFDVISDYTVNLEQWVGEGSPAYKISEQYS